MLPPPPTDIDGDSEKMQRSISLDVVPQSTESTPVGPEIASRAHRAVSPDGVSCYQV